MKFKFIKTYGKSEVLLHMNFKPTIKNWVLTIHPHAVVRNSFKRLKYDLKRSIFTSIR